MNLDTLREQVDGINKEIVTLIAERLEITKEIGKIKALHGLSITDIARESHQLTQLMEMAKELQISPFIIEQVFTVIVEYSKLMMKLEQTA